MMEPEITTDHSPPEVSSAEQPSQQPPDQALARQPASPSQAEPIRGAGRRRPQAPGALGAGLRTCTPITARTQAIKGVNIDFPANEVTALIGPSGSGKSTVVRCINRMHEEIPGARAEGSVMLDDLDVYEPQVDVTAVRRAIGMVFQKPNPFPTMSIFDNVAAGLRLTGTKRRQPARASCTSSLRAVGLWGEVKDRLSAPGHRPLRRPAAAPLHRAHDRGRARGDPDGRAVPRRSTRSRR